MCDLCTGATVALVPQLYDLSVTCIHSVGTDIRYLQTLVSGKSVRAYSLFVFLLLGGTELCAPNRQATAVGVEAAPCASHRNTIQ